MTYYEKKRIAFWCTGFFILFLLIILEQLSQKTDAASEGSHGQIIFSKQSGFYEDVFELELTAESGTIYYTLDGSIPDKNSIKYSKPILITDATDNDNVYAMRTDASAGFYTEEIAKYSSDDPGYTAPAYKIDKATVVRAVIQNELGQYSDVQTESYFIGFSHKSGYEGMKVLNLVMEPSDLFDYETGIYVTGKAYDDYVKEYRNGDEYYWREEFWALWLANYRNRGIKWEKEAVCQFYDEKRALVCEQDCGIRIHGGISRGYNPKSLNIYARKEYDGNKRIQSDLFGTGYYPSAVTLFQGGNDMRTKAKDYLISAAIKDLNISVMNFEPYVMFLNGEYWGIYWLNEKYNSQYLEHYYNVDKNNVILIKSGELEEGDEEDYNYYSKMINFCSESDVTDEENYKKVCEMIDIESYLDYYAVMLYIGRSGDWPSMNYALWRVKKNENTLYGDGKWRWMVYDLNTPGSGADSDPIAYVTENDEMFKNLMTNDTFRATLIHRTEELADSVFDFEKMDEEFNRYQIFIEHPMRENDKRFFGDDSLDAFHIELEAQKSFFRERKKYLLPILEKYKCDAQAAVQK